MKYVIDRSSLIYLQRYYIFDKYHARLEYEKFRDFIKSKFNNGEIVIIDKVENEGINWIVKEFEIDNRKIINTDDNIDRLLKVAYDERIKNEKCEYDDTQKQAEREKEINNKADLSLVAYCQKLKGMGEDACLITEESKSNNYNIKVYKKIPNICENYDIKCYNLPHLIFNEFRQHMQFHIELLGGANSGE